MVATGGCRDRDGAPRHRVQSLHRCAARRARSEAQRDGGAMSVASHAHTIAGGEMNAASDGQTRTGVAMNAGTDPLVSVRNLEVSFRLDRDTVFEAVKGISFDVPRNATVALVGESGSGKSVTALAMLGLLPPENSIIGKSSQILFGGHDNLRLSPGDLRAMRGAEISMI